MEFLEELLKPILVLASMGLLFGLGLSLVFKKFGVEPDEKTEKLRVHLPGANCGGCGYSGCDAFASALAEGKASINECAVCNAKQKQGLAEVLGQTVEHGERRVARVHCNGGCSCADKYIYAGLDDCAAAISINGGPKNCANGCVGLGNCVKACAFGAMSIAENGVARADEEKCTACGACVKACPKGLITIENYAQRVSLQCNSAEKGKTVRQTCGNGCIGCGLCAKNCPEQAIVMEGNLPHIDMQKCVGCLVCVEKCPTHAIVKTEETCVG